MNYWLYVPEHATEDMPLIVFLHGTGQIAAINLLEDFGLVNNVYEIYGNEFPFLLMLPNTTVRSWTQPPVTTTLIGLINEVSSQHCVDRDHIILTGHSLGAISTWQMISEYGDYFSAAVPVSYGFGKTLNYENIAKVPIKAYVGSYETECAGNMKKLVKEILESGGNIELITLDECNHSDTVTKPYSKDLFEWMLMQ